MPRSRRHRAAMPHYDHRRRAITLGGGLARGWWDPNQEGLCVWAAYQPVAAGSFTISLMDLSGNGNNAADPGGAGTPGWNAVNGWIFDGLANHLTTTFIPQNDQSQSGIVQYTNAAAGANDYIYGCRGGPATIDRFHISASWADLGIIYGHGNFVTSLPQLLAGNLCITGNQGYRNGIADGGPIAGFGIPPVQPAYIGCSNLAGVPTWFFDGRIQALAIYDCALTAPQVLAVATAMAAL